MTMHSHSQDCQVEGRKSDNMAVPHVTSFCCCFGLEMGAKVIGYLHLIIAICLVVTCSLFASQFASLVGTVEDAGGLYSVYHKVSAVVAGISIGHCLLAGVLLYGVYKRSSRCVCLWVWAMLVALCVSLGALCANVAVTGVADTGSDIFLSFLIGIIAFGAIVYSILCVYSFYLMLKSCEDMEGPTNTPY